MKIKSLKNIVLSTQCIKCVDVHEDVRNELCGNIRRIREMGMPNYTSKYNPHNICNDYQTIKKSWGEMIKNWCIKYEKRKN